MSRHRHLNAAGAVRINQFNPQRQPGVLGHEQVHRALSLLVVVGIKLISVCHRAVHTLIADGMEVGELCRGLRPRPALRDVTALPGRDVDREQAAFELKGLL